MLNRAYRAYGLIIGWDLGPLQTNPQHDGSFHIEITPEAYEWVVTERGSELERLSFDTRDALLEHIFINLTFGAGVKYEVARRDPARDPRRIIFQHQLDLLAKLNPAWRDSAKQHIAEVLEKYPYRDTPS